MSFSVVIDCYISLIVTLGVSVIESFEKNVKPRELEETLRLEYRSKFLNPKWADVSTLNPHRERT